MFWCKWVVGSDIEETMKIFLEFGQQKILQTGMQKLQKPQTA